MKKAKIQHRDKNYGISLWENSIVDAVYMLKWFLDKAVLYKLCSEELLGSVTGYKGSAERIWKYWNLLGSLN